MCLVFWGKGRLHASCRSGLHLTDWSREKLELRLISSFHHPWLDSALPFLPKASESCCTSEARGAGDSALPISRSINTRWRVPRRQKASSIKMSTSEIAFCEDLIYFLAFWKIKRTVDFLHGLPLELRINWPFFFLYKTDPDPANNLESCHLCLTHQEISPKRWIFFL